MAAQVCAADNIFLYARINQDSSDCTNIGIADDWSGLFKTKIEIIKNKRAHDL